MKKVGGEVIFLDLGGETMISSRNMSVQQCKVTYKRSKYEITKVNTHSACDSVTEIGYACYKITHHSIIHI